MDSPSYIQRCPDGVVMAIQVQPNAGKTELAGEHNGRLKLKVCSPPVDGKANKELCKFLARYFGVAKSRVEILRGESCREKDVLLRGADEDAIARILHLEAEGSR